MYPVYSSDPHLSLCNDNGSKLCLYASVDDGHGSDANYPMRHTKLWTIDRGANWKVASNWTYVGVVASESMINGNDINPRTSHFWAPAAIRHNSKNYLFVPDLYNGQVNTGSRVYVDATSQNGPYTYRGRINTPTEGPTAPNGGYASDPFVVRDYDGSVHMFYANGNFGTCGGITRTALSGSNLTSTSNTARISFTDDLRTDLGTCGGGNPYLEGPAVYNRYRIYDIPGRWPTSFDGIGNHEWIMMFSVKPSRTPTRTNPTSVTCNGSGQQALAYATASSLTSTTWTYRGIIMCPRGGEWTNHGSLIRNTHDVILAFHDGPSSNHRRKVMLDCLTWNTNGALRTVPVSQNNAANCNNW